MKKLMFAATVAAAMAGFAVESQVVGYQQVEIPHLTSIACLTFENVSEGGMNLQDFKPLRTSEEGIEDGISQGDIQVQTLTEDGESDTVYVYNPEGMAGDGWYDESVFWELADLPLDFGQGLVLSSEYEDAAFMHSGAVNSEDTAVEIPHLTSIFGNTRPTALDMQDVVPFRTSPEGIEDGISQGDIQVQTFTEDGESDVVYVYNPEGMAGAGWYDESVFWELADLVLEPGQALIISSEYEDAVLELPELF